MIPKMEVFSPRTYAPELQLGGDTPSSDPVQIRGIEGLGPVKASVTTSPYAAIKGEAFVGSSVGKRNIVLTMGLNPNWVDQTITSLRHLLYKYFIPQQWVKLRFFSEVIPDVDIEGYVESFEPNLFSKDPEMQISIICPQPDFVDVAETVINGDVGDGSVETIVDYIGTADTGFTLRVDTTTSNPTFSGLLSVVVKQPEANTFTVAGVVVDADTYFEMRTIPQDKYVRNVESADPDTFTDLLKLTEPAVQWPMLKFGENDFSVVAISDLGQPWTLSYYNRFEGL